MSRVIQHQEASRTIPTDEVERRLLSLIDHQPRHIDEISAQSGLAAGSVSAKLTIMELKGLIRQVGGMKYVR